MIMKQFTGAKLSSPQVGTIQMDEIQAIRESLSTRGIVHTQQQLEDAWLYLTPFTYSMDFPWRDDSFERYELYGEYLSGSGEVRLNGQFVCAFDTGELRADVTPHLEADNRLEIIFLPFIPEAPTARFDSGIYGNLCIRGTNFLTLDGFSVEPVDGDGLRANVDLTCHASGWYDFVYTLSREDGSLVKRQTFSKKLRTLAAHLSHDLPLSGDPSRLRLTIERGGILADEWDAGIKWAAMPSALCAVRADDLYSQGVHGPAGPFHCAQFLGRAPSLHPRRLTEAGLLLLKSGETSPMKWPDPAHPLSGEMLDAAISRALTLGLRPCYPPPSGEDMASAAVKRMIERLRLPHAFADPGEGSDLFPGSLQRFAIWFAGDRRAAYPLLVSAAAYDPEGKPLSSATFTAYGEETNKLGEMSLNVPESLDHMCIRIATTGFTGGEAAVHDTLYFRGGLKNASLLPPSIKHLPENGEIHSL